MPVDLSAVHYQPDPAGPAIFCRSCSAQLRRMAVRITRGTSVAYYCPVPKQCGSVATITALGSNKLTGPTVHAADPWERCESSFDLGQGIVGCRRTLSSYCVATDGIVAQNSRATGVFCPSPKAAELGPRCRHEKAPDPPTPKG